MQSLRRNSVDLIFTTNRDTSLNGSWLAITKLVQKHTGQLRNHFLANTCSCWPRDFCFFGLWQKPWPSKQKAKLNLTTCTVHIERAFLHWLNMNAWSKENIGHPLLQVFAQNLCQKLCGSMLEHPFLAKSVKRFWSHCWLLWYVCQDEASLKPGRFVDMNQLKMLIFGMVTSFFNCSFSRVCTRSGQVVWQFYEKLPKIVFFQQ